MPQVTRKKMPNDWHKRAQAIQAKITEAVEDLPPELLAQLPGGADAPIDYFRAVQIRDKLAEGGERTLFGGLTGAAGLWDNIVKAYEKQSEPWGIGRPDLWLLPPAAVTANCKRSCTIVCLVSKLSSLSWRCCLLTVAYRIPPATMLAYSAKCMFALRHIPDLQMCTWGKLPPAWWPMWTMSCHTSGSRRPGESSCRIHAAANCAYMLLLCLHDCVCWFLSSILRSCVHSGHCHTLYHTYFLSGMLS